MAKHYLWAWLAGHVKARVSAGQYAELGWELWRGVGNKARNAFSDWKAGGWYGGYVHPINENSYGTLSTDWRALDHLFHLLEQTGAFKKTEPTVDVGSGKGRVVRWLLDHGYRKIVGVELNPRLAASSQRHFRYHPEVEIIEGSILHHLRYEWRQFFLFNPFPPDVLSEFLTQLRFLHPEGKVVVVYYNSASLDFSRATDFAVYEANLNCQANLRSVAVLILKPIAQLPRSDSQPGETPPLQAATPPGSTDTPSS